MHKKNHSVNEQHTSNFLAKFQGKINILSKFGEINHGDIVHLPTIKTNHSRRSNTFNFSNLSTKKSFSSVCSNIRQNQNKTSDTLKRNYYNCNQEKKSIKSQIRSRHLQPLQPLDFNYQHISRVKYEPLSAALPFKKSSTFLDKQDNKLKKDEISEHAANSLKEKREKTDYSIFLKELNIISSEGVRRSQIR